MAISKELRVRVHKKLDGHCGYCGKDITIKQMQVDHMNPVSLQQLDYFKDGDKEFFVDKTNDFSNLMPSCRRCNHYKRASTVDQFRHTMKTLHERCAKHYINKVAIDFGIMQIKEFNGTFYFESIK